MSFGGEPGRDDGGLPPVNIEIPDDARELDRDVLAYRREQRARRRRERLRRLFAPFAGHGAALPLIATCVALSMLAGAMLSVFAVSPAAAPTRSPQAAPSPSRQPSGRPVGDRALPPGTVQLDGKTEPVRSLVTAVLALVPANCGCGSSLERLANQAATAHVRMFFVGTGPAISQLSRLTARYGSGTATAVVDKSDVLGTAFSPVGLTVLLVHSDAIAEVQRDLPTGFQLPGDLGRLHEPSEMPVIESSSAASPAST